MSDSLFPPPGVKLSLNYRKKARVGVIRHEIDSGYSSTVQRTVWPTYEYDLPFNVLRQGDPDNLDSQGNPADGERELLGFWMAHRGGESFLFKDPQDYQVTNAAFAIGDGATTTFRLLRPFGTFFTEPINNVVSGTLTVEQGVPAGPFTELTITTEYAVDLELGLVTVVTPVPIGEILRASFEFNWRAKFMDDEQEIQRFEHNYFRARRVRLETLKVR